MLGETTTTVTTRGKSTTTSVTSVEVLTDVLGSAVATASDGVISADLHLFGDFGDELTSPKVDTVTAFTGKVSTAGLTEFASRTYDPSSRVWLQDDRFRGTTTRAASLNRYAYVEGAPQSFVDVLGFYRARAAIRAQQLAAAQAAYDAAVKAYAVLVSNAHMQDRLFQREVGQIQAQAAAKKASDAWAVAQREAARVSVFSASTVRTSSSSSSGCRSNSACRGSQYSAAGANGGAPPCHSFECRGGAPSSANRSGWNAVSGLASTVWNGTKTAASTVWHAGVSLAVAAPKTPADFWDRGTTAAEYALLAGWRRLKNPRQTAFDVLSGTAQVETVAASFQIWASDAEL